ncbi:MAG: isoleucine--tRNA ligase, partial [Clostridiales bacterium]|nr:isoleucine--tRNA ligase [Clostridiales bacterium]
LLIETAQTEGYESLSDGGFTVVIDTNLTPELIEEGFVREIVSKIQTMRKDSGFEVMDNINVYFDENARIAEIASRNAQSIKSDVLGENIVFGAKCATSKLWNLNGEDVYIGVEKI